MFWINLGLFTIVSLLSFNVYRVWLPIVRGEWKQALPVAAKTISKKAAVLAEEETSKPALYTYDVIADKDLFRPERTEWLPPPPKDDTEESKKVNIPQYPSERHKAGMKKPVLYGVIITKNKKCAIMKGSIRQEPKKRSRKVRLGNGEVREVPLPPIPGKVVDDKIRTYQVGDEISESTIVDILADRVVLSKNGEEYELLLREVSRMASQKSTVPGQGAPQNRQGNQKGKNFPPGRSGFSNRQIPPPGYAPPPGYPAYRPPPGFPTFRSPSGVPSPGYQRFPGGVSPQQAPLRQFQGQRSPYAPPPGFAPPRGQRNPFFNPFRGGS